MTATNDATGVAVKGQANETGNYTIQALPPGQYQVEATFEGLKPQAVATTLNVMAVQVINFQLQVANTTQQVTVTDQAPIVDAATSAIGTDIQGPEVTDLPLNGRNVMELSVLSPGTTGGVPDGVSSGAGGNAKTFRYGDSGGASISVNGVREQANNYTPDGVDDNESLVNTSAIFPQDEAVTEYRVQEKHRPRRVRPCRRRVGAGLYEVRHQPVPRHRLRVSA